MTAGDSGAAIVLPPLAGELDVLWELILDLAEHRPEHDWVLVGGQMVMLHALAAGRAPTRASRDVDVLADLVSAPASLARCVEALQRLDLLPTSDSAGKVYRFRRARDNATVDLLAPDHSPPRYALRTMGGDTIRVVGGTQALRRALLMRVSKGDRAAVVPVPSPAATASGCCASTRCWVIRTQRSGGDSEGRRGTRTPPGDCCWAALVVLAERHASAAS